MVSPHVSQWGLKLHICVVDTIRNQKFYAVKFYLVDRVGKSALEAHIGTWNNLLWITGVVGLRFNFFACRMHFLRQINVTFWEIFAHKYAGKKSWRRPKSRRVNWVRINSTPPPPQSATCTFLWVSKRIRINRTPLSRDLTILSNFYYMPSNFECNNDNGIGGR